MEEYIEHKVKTRVEKYVTVAFKIFFGILAAIAFALLIGYGVMWLWNWLMPDLFGLATIGYWQAVGILVLAKVLFGGFGSDHSKKSRGKSRKHLKNKLQGNCRSDFSRWKFYDQFWEEEGEKAYQQYIEKRKSENGQ